MCVCVCVYVCDVSKIERGQRDKKCVCLSQYTSVCSTVSMCACVCVCVCVCVCGKRERGRERE